MAYAQKLRAACPKGHPYDETNTLRSGGRRHCRACMRRRWLLKHGKPRREMAEILWSRIGDRSSGCWMWSGAMAATTGYGVYGASGRGKTTLAHRLVWELVMGPIPDGLVVDHLCRNRRCVNPGHMEIVTIGENVRRGAASRKKERDEGSPDR